MLLFLSSCSSSGTPKADAVQSIEGRIFVELEQVLPDSTGINDWSLGLSPEPWSALLLETERTYACGSVLEIRNQGLSPEDSLQRPNQPTAIHVDGVRIGSGCEGDRTAATRLEFGRLDLGTHLIHVSLEGAMATLRIAVEDSFIHVESDTFAISVRSPKLVRLAEGMSRVSCSDLTGYCEEVYAYVLPMVALEERFPPSDLPDPWRATGEARYFRYSSDHVIKRAAELMDFHWFHFAFAESAHIEIRTWKNQYWIFSSAEIN